jgi:hypothetical protein
MEDSAHKGNLGNLESTSGAGELGSAATFSDPFSLSVSEHLSVSFVQIPLIAHPLIKLDV